MIYFFQITFIGLFVYLFYFYIILDANEDTKEASNGKQQATEDTLEEESAKVESESEESQQSPQPGVASDNGSVS